MKPSVAIIMGSDSDLLVMSEATAFLNALGVSTITTVVSAHRTPDRLVAFAKDAEARDIKVIIAGAGGAAHLPGMVASFSTLPVIGVPIKTKNLDGLDSLLSIAQMPPGIPVATVAINGGKNAGILAAEILALSDATLSNKLKKFKKNLRVMVEKKAKRLEKQGFKKYLKNL